MLASTQGDHRHVVGAPVLARELDERGRQVREVVEAGGHHGTVEDGQRQWRHRLW